MTKVDHREMCQKMALSQDDLIIELKGIVNKLTNKVYNINKQLSAINEHSSSDRLTMQASARPKILRFQNLLSNLVGIVAKMIMLDYNVRSYSNAMGAEIGAIINALLSFKPEVTAVPGNMAAKCEQTPIPLKILLIYQAT